MTLLIEVLLEDLERAHFAEETRRAQGNHSSADMLRLSIVDVADHIERFEAVYRLAVHDPADGGVYEALVHHFREYAVSFIELSTHQSLPTSNRAVVAQFLAHGFAGAIKAWLSDPTVSKDDLIDAATACAPVWWG